MRIELALGVAVLTACSGYSGPSAETRAERARTRLPEPSADVAGGETSEFSGNIASCPEIASSEPLDLADPEVASWVAMAQGHHEQTLGWRRLILSDEVVGFTEHTTVSIDVNVLRGREVAYGSGGNTDNELAGCEGLRARQIELEITLTTGDGAVVTTFRRWFQPGPTDTRGTVLHHHGLNPDGSGALDSLSGTLELRPDPALGGIPWVGVELEFSADSVRGSLSTGIAPDAGAWNLSSWSPIEAVFPDDPCGSQGGSIGLDDSLEYLAGTPRAYYQRIVRSLAGKLIAAVWRSSPSNVQPSPLDVPLDVPAPTTVSLSLGEPTLACAVETSATLHAPLTVTTADGLVSFTQPFVFDLSDSGTYVGERTPWVPAADFNAHGGIGGLNLERGYGSIYFQHGMTWWNGLIEGSLEVSQWDAFTEGRPAYPVLEWCNAPQCAPATE